MAETNLVRPYRDDDFAALGALIDEILAPERVMTRASLRSFLSVPGYCPQTDLFVASSPTDNELVGARDVRITARGDEDVLILESWGDVHPAVRGSAIAGVLLRTALDRGKRLVSDRGRARGIFQARCDADDHLSAAAFEAVGLHHARDIVTMKKSTLDDINEPHFPAGVTLRTYRVGDDDAAWVAAFNEAFAGHWGGFMGISADLWGHYRGGAEFKPEISLVATDGPEIAGFCHCRIDDELNALTGRRLGMIRYIGVRPAWRGRGLGTALTLASLRTLRDAGMDAVVLGVDAENVTGARRLYDRHGFTFVGCQVMYRGDLIVVVTPATQGGVVRNEGELA
jgi:mycothiol synthase